jgi:signal transduction histidine kinase/ActR/RegA family two-component response regulator
VNDSQAEIQAVRLRLLWWMLAGLAVIGLPMWTLTVASLAQRGLWLMMVLLTAGYLLLAICAVRRERLPIGLRAAVLEITLYGIGVYSLAHAGLAGPGPALMIAMAVLAAVLFGLRSGLLFSAIGTLTLGLAGLGFSTGVLVLHPQVLANLDTLGTWASATALLTALCFAMVATPGLLQRALLQSLAEREAALRALEAEGVRRTQLETEKQSISEQLHQAQKMEAVGQLAGGVAHDFNNVLTAVRGHIELALRRLDPASSAARHLASSLRSADRAQELTGRLLAFSRRKVMEIEPLSLHACLADLDPMLRRLIGEEIALRIERTALRDVVRADRGQLELVILNLVVNARDAMPEGGRLTLRTSNLVHGAITNQPPRVVLEVEDTGIGMSEAVMARIFEPFFTTKEPGQGTGLGLTMAFSILEQHGGTIAVRSQPGQGTVFTIALDACNEQPVVQRPATLPRSSPGGRERVLLVEDDPMVLETTEAMLEELGYRVAVASNPDQALALVQSGAVDPDILLTDVVLPGCNGRELAERMLALQPGLRVLFTSGYTDDDVLRRGVASEHVHFLAKPFSPSRLAHKLREALGDEEIEGSPEVTEEVGRGR